MPAKLRYDVAPKTEIGKKIEQLAEKLPYKELYLPDPYDPTSYITPLIGSIAKQGGKKVFKKAVGPFGGIFEDIGTQFRPGGEGSIPSVVGRAQQLATQYTPKLGKKDSFGKNLSGMNWRPVLKKLDELTETIGTKLKKLGE